MKTRKGSALWDRSDVPPLDYRALALAFAALAVSYLALVFVAVDSDFGQILLGFDFTVPQRFAMDAFSGRFPVTGYRLPVPSFIFPDMMVWLPLASVFPYELTYALYSFVQIGISTVGWVLVCRRLGGGGLTQCMVVFAHALPVILLTYAGNDLFFLLLPPIVHAGVWAVMPWLLLAFLSFSYRGNVSLFVMLVLLGASDLIVVPWFVGPLCATLAVFWRRGDLSGRYAVGVGVGAVAAVVIGRAAFLLASPFGDSLTAEQFLAVKIHIDQFFLGLGGLQYVLFTIAKHYWGLAVIWSLFMAVLIIFLFRLFRANRHPALLFVMIFVLVSIASSAMGPVVTANVEWIKASKLYPEGGNAAGDTLHIRYIFPTVYFPLFVGWFLLILPIVGRLPAFGAGRAFSVAGVFLALVTVAAAPSFFREEGQSVRLFETPYAVCVRDAAQRLGWTAGIGPRRFWDRSILDPDNPIRHNLYMENYTIFRHVSKDEPFWVQWDFTNRHSYSGEFQVVVVTRYADRDFRFGVPRDRNDVCEEDGCVGFDIPQASLYDAEMVRDFFGEPTEVVECEGVELFHYDPPFVYDFSNRDQTGDYPFPLPRQVRDGEDGVGSDG